MLQRRSNSALAALATLLPLLAGCSDLLRDDGSSDADAVNIPAPAGSASREEAHTTAERAPTEEARAAAPAVAQGADAPEVGGEAAGAASMPEPTPAPAHPAVQAPPEAVDRFDRALAWMRSGDDVAAETELRRMSADYPQLAAPQTNLGILYRKAGRTDDAAAAFREAVQRNPASAAAWNELGVTLRQQGRFADAVGAYERAIAADATFAPAHRNLGIVLDVYLGETARALEELERYQQLAGEDKVVAGWVADLRQRAGKAAKPASGEGKQP